MQRSGGSRQHPAAALEEALEERAASIEGGAGGEAFGFGFSCLREDAPDVMQLFAEVCCLPVCACVMSAAARLCWASCWGAVGQQAAGKQAATTLQGRCLRPTLQVVLQPAIPQDKLDLAKTQAGGSSLLLCHALP